MIYDKEKYTLGCELELADVDTEIDLGNLGVWDKDDYTIVNSSGIGNDNRKQIVRFGVEINTTPTIGVETQLSIVMDILNLLPNKSNNYTCNLHIHCGVEGLKDDLETVMRVTEYFVTHQHRIFQLTEKLEIPTKEQYQDDEAYKCAIKRYKRRKESHQQPITEKIFSKMKKATTMQEYFESYVNFDKNMKPQWQFVKRPGCNTLQLRDIGTIEFRHFSITFDKKLMENCLRWVVEIMDAAINTNKTPDEVFKDLGEPEFPKFLPYDHELGKIFKLTHFGKLSRNTIKENLNNLLIEGKIKKGDIGYEL